MKTLNGTATRSAKKVNAVIDEAADDPKPDPAESARAAGLVYTHHDRPGITRRRAGTAFAYYTPDGEKVVDAETIRRIKSLAIPPAYEGVWICPNPRGHIQAVGTDDRGRTQYRYHPKWREVRDEAKYGRMIAFGRALPGLRRRVAADLKLDGLPRLKVLATIVKLLETTLIRVGNEAYAKENQHYGLTTIRNDHVDVRGSHIHFEFRGKSGVDHAIDLTDKRLADVIHQCQELPEQELFEYVDHDGTRHHLGSHDVNAYLQEVTGQPFTAKDFRTWAGTTLAAMALQEFEAFDSQAQAKKNVVAAIEKVSKRLGNTRSVCRKCYVHPAVFDIYMEGTLAESLKGRLEQKLKRSLHSLKPEEAAVMSLLQERLKREAGKAATAGS